MSWLILVLLAVLALSVANLLQRVLMKDEKSDVASFAFVSQIISTIFAFAVVIVTGFSLPPLHQIGLNLVLLTVLYGAGNIFLFKSFKKFVIIP